MPSHLFAGMRVRDFEVSLAWYKKLLGEPTFFPHETEAVWTIAEHRSVYVVQHPQSAGASVLLVFVDDLDAKLLELDERGLQPDVIELWAAGRERLSTAIPTATSLGSAERPRLGAAG